MRPTVVAESRWIFAVMWLGFPLLGAGAGWLLVRAAGFADRPWVPLPGPVRVLAELPEPQTTLVAVAVGAVAGLVLALIGAHESLTVTVSPEAVELARAGASRRIARAPVGAVFLDGRQLVLLGPDGAELAREPNDLGARRLGAAFQAHGYPWRPDGDPYADAFRRWVPGLPDLPPGADALFAARAKALAAGDRRDAAELRTELAQIGVVVRNEGKRQYWRRIPR